MNIIRNVQVADNIATTNPLIFNGVAILGVFSANFRAGWPGQPAGTGIGVGRGRSLAIGAQKRA